MEVAVLTILWSIYLKKNVGVLTCLSVMFVFG